MRATIKLGDDQIITTFGRYESVCIWKTGSKTLLWQRILSYGLEYVKRCVLQYRNKT